MKCVAYNSMNDMVGLSSLQSAGPLVLFQLMEVIVQVYISKNDLQWGPFDLNQLARLKGEGVLKATDWAWEQGESGWVPLAAVLERHGNWLPVWRPAAAQRRTWKFYAPVTVRAVCVMLLIALG